MFSAGFYGDILVLILQISSYIGAPNAKLFDNNLLNKTQTLNQRKTEMKQNSADE